MAELIPVAQVATLALRRSLSRNMFCYPPDMFTKPLPLAVFVLLAACKNDAPRTSNLYSPTPTNVKKAATPVPVDMDAAARELMAKAEQPDERIEVQHILIAFKGAPRMTAVTRSKEDAKALAQKVYAEAVGGSDFGALVKQYTDDSSPGIYPITKAGRAGMVRAFGDVGFRLKVGEIGVAVWDASASPYGWHIIKRLK